MQSRSTSRTVHSYVLAVAFVASTACSRTGDRFTPDIDRSARHHGGSDNGTGRGVAAGQGAARIVAHRAATIRRIILKNVFVQTIGPDDMAGAAQIGGKPVPGIGDKAIWAGGTMFV